MAGAVATQKGKEDKEEKNRRRSWKGFLLFGLLLFFSGIAVLSVVLENPRGIQVLARSESAGNELPLIQSADGNLDGSSASSVADAAGCSESEDSFPVYIVGEILNPGIYEMKPGMFLYQLVEMAGGFTDNAAKDRINLAFQITQNMMVRIPGVLDADGGEAGGVSGGILFQDSGTDFAETAQGESQKININTADASQLDLLPGIGPATAALIIEYRAKNGKFAAIEDLMKIPGIKQSKFDRIKDRIVL